jgi:hypothetical protein
VSGVLENIRSKTFRFRRTVSPSCNGQVFEPLSLISCGWIDRKKTSISLYIKCERKETLVAGSEVS